MVSLYVLEDTLISIHKLFFMHKYKENQISVLRFHNIKYNAKIILVFLMKNYSFFSKSCFLLHYSKNKHILSRRFNDVA